jgi:hypothetical protein
VTGTTELTVPASILAAGHVGEVHLPEKRNIQFNVRYIWYKKSKVKCKVIPVGGRGGL